MPTEAPLSGSKDIRIFLVDDHEVVRHGLVMSLLNFVEDVPQSDIHIRFVGGARTGAEALNTIESSGANVAFVDVMLPDMNGLTVIRQLRERGLDAEKLRVLVVTELTAPNVREIFAAGANGYITKQEESAVFVEALRFIVHNPQQPWVQPVVAQQLLKVEYTLKAYGLTPQEIEVLQLLHLSNPEIAEVLHSSVSTIRSHLSSIYDKFNVPSRKEATEIARRLGLVSILH